MNLDRFHKISEIVAAFAIVGSLIFVGVQVGQNTRALKFNATNTISDQWIGMARDVALSNEFRDIFHRGLNPVDGNVGKLDPKERTALVFWFTGTLKSYEIGFMHWRDGFVSDRMWQGQQQTIRQLMRNPGVRALWHETLFDNYSEDFEAFINQLISEIEELESSKASSVE